MVVHQPPQVADVNCPPLSVVMTDSTPKASRTAWEMVSLSRTASGHLVDLLIMLRRWVSPALGGGSGPTMSTCTWLKLAVGVAIFSTVVVGYLVTLALAGSTLLAPGHHLSC